MTPRGVVGTKECKKLRFFKIVFGEDSSKVMYLPPMIAQKVKHLAGRETIIEDTSGARWSVTVSEVNGSLAFQRGWPEFFSDHRLKKGEVLVFKYITGSHFVVRIFGLSACDRVNFDDEVPRANKRVRRNPGPAVEEEPFQTININSGDVPLSDTSVASEVGRSPPPMEMDFINCMMKKEDGCNQGEDRTIWDDLLMFEQNILLLPSPNESQNVAKSHIGFSEQAKSIGNDVQMDEVYTRPVEGHSDESLTDKLEKPLYMKVAPTHSDIVAKTKKLGGDAEIDVIQTNQIKGHSDGIFKAVETKAVPFHHGNTKQAKEKGCDTQTAAIHSSRTDIKHLKKPSESSSSRKGIFDLSSVQNGSSKIPQGRYEAESWFPEFSASSAVAKDPSGKRSTIKTETIEIEDEAGCFPRASSGKEPTMVDNHEQMKVKPEPQFYDDKAAFDPFLAEVKSKLYLELPEEITSFRQQRNRKERGAKIVYLRDSKERLWPLFYPNKPGVMALCVNWTNFCNENNIEPGDKCWFQSESASPCTVRVDVIPTCGEVPHE